MASAEKTKKKNIFQRIGGAFQRRLTAPVSSQGINIGRTISDLLPAWRGTYNRGDNIPQQSDTGYTRTPYAPGRAPVPSSPTGVYAPTSTPPIIPIRPSTAPLGGGIPRVLSASSPATPTLSSGGGNEIDKFNLAIMDLLNKAKGQQSGNQAEFEKQRRALMREQISRSRGEDSGLSQEELGSLSPSQQESMRNAGIGALSPDIDEVAYQLRKIELQQKNLDELQTQARKYGDERLDRELEKDRADLEKQKFDLEKQKFAETKRSNLATEAQKGAAGGVSPYQTERATRTVQSVDELLGQVNNWTTGWGSLLGFVPGSDAKGFKAQLNTLKANIAFNELTAMREASKTGGALGQVSNIELTLLESALGALDRAQSPAQFKEQLEKIKASVNRWNAAAGGGASESSGTGNQPQTMVLNGQTLTLQADGTYQ